MKILKSYKIKQDILKYLFEKCSLSSGIIFWTNVDEIYKNVSFEKYNEGIKYEKKYEKKSIIGLNYTDIGSSIDEDYTNPNRLLITEYDVTNIFDELERDGFIKQDSSKEQHFHKIILQLKGKEFYFNGGYNKRYFIRKWIKKNIIIITLIISLLTILISLFLVLLTHHLLRMLIK